jgi:hypothetical protein
VFDLNIWAANGPQKPAPRPPTPELSLALNPIDLGILRLLSTHIIPSHVSTATSSTASTASWPLVTRLPASKVMIIRSAVISLLSSSLYATMPPESDIPSVSFSSRLQFTSALHTHSFVPLFEEIAPPFSDSFILATYIPANRFRTLRFRTPSQRSSYPARAIQRRFRNSLADLKKEALIAQPTTAFRRYSSIWILWKSGRYAFQQTLRRPLGCLGYPWRGSQPP